VLWPHACRLFNFTLVQHLYCSLSCLFWQFNVTFLITIDWFPMHTLVCLHLLIFMWFDLPSSFEFRLCAENNGKTMACWKSWCVLHWKYVYIIKLCRWKVRDIHTNTHASCTHISREREREIVWPSCLRGMDRRCLHGLSWGMGRAVPN